jgi:hypothetical protein
LYYLQFFRKVRLLGISTHPSQLLENARARENAKTAWSASYVAAPLRAAFGQKKGGHVPIGGNCGGYDLSGL